MKPAIVAILKKLLEKEITVYTTGLRVKGELFLIDMDLRIIGIQPETKENTIIIDIKSINAFEAEDIGDYL